MDYRAAPPEAASRPPLMERKRRQVRTGLTCRWWRSRHDRRSPASRGQQWDQQDRPSSTTAPEAVSADSEVDQDGSAEAAPVPSHSVLFLELLPLQAHSSFSSPSFDYASLSPSLPLLLLFSPPNFPLFSYCLFLPCPLLSFFFPPSPFLFPSPSASPSPSSSLPSLFLSLPSPYPVSRVPNLVTHGASVDLLPPLVHFPFLFRPSRRSSNPQPRFNTAARYRTAPRNARHKNARPWCDKNGALDKVPEQGARTQFFGASLAAASLMERMPVFREATSSGSRGKKASDPHREQ